MRLRIALALSTLASLVALYACGGKQPLPKEPPATESLTDASAADVEAEPPPPLTLYERLGKKEGLAKLVDALLENIKKDNALKKAFAKTKGDRAEKLKEHLVAMLCDATGGECGYAGKPMGEAHKGLRVTEPQWNAFVSDLKAALDSTGVGEAEQADLIALLAPLKDEIVDPKTIKK